MERVHRIPEPDELTKEDAERLLSLYGGRAGQERLILAADRLGISANEMLRLAGIARTTTARVLRRQDGSTSSPPGGRP